MTQPELDAIVKSVPTNWHPPGEGTEFGERQVAFSKARGNLHGIDPNLAKCCGLAEPEELTVDLENDPVSTLGPASVELSHLSGGTDRALDHFCKNTADEVKDPEGSGCGRGCFTTETVLTPACAEGDPIVKAILAKLFDPAEQDLVRSRKDVLLAINSGTTPSVHKSARVVDGGPLEKRTTESRLGDVFTKFAKVGATVEQCEELAKIYGKMVKAMVHDGEEPEPEEVEAD